jgi:hypothetical protein
VLSFLLNTIKNTNSLFFFSFLFLFAKVASGPLLTDGVESVRENREPLSLFEEVADSLGPHEVHSGWLQPGMRYAFRVRLHTSQGSVCTSTPPPPLFFFKCMNV